MLRSIYYVISKSCGLMMSLRNEAHFVIAWVMWAACLRGLISIAWVAWVACLREWCARVCSIGGVDGVLPWASFYYYYCYYWNTTLKKNKLSVNFYKNEKMFQIDLSSDLKEEPDLKSRYCFTLLWTDLNPNVGKHAPICVVLWICLNIRET